VVAAVLQVSSASSQPTTSNGADVTVLDSGPAYHVAPAVTLRAGKAARPQQQAEDQRGEDQQRALRPGVPNHVVIPRLGVRAPVIGITALGGVLTPPADPQTLGWWAPGARPGAARGSALITGHTVSSGGGALDDLEHLRAGDPVTVRTSHGSVEYVVRQVSIYRKASLARNAEKLFNQGVPGRLVLVTCEDWNGEVYLSNVVVIADPVAS
jgi:LPXTG-site transpeptidase (sortase) family protein